MPLRVWSSSTDAPRLRRPTDVLLLLAGLLLLAITGLEAPGPTSLDKALTQLLASVAGWLDWLWPVAYALLAVWAVLVVVLPLVTRGRRRLLVDQLLAALLAFGLAVGASMLAGTDWDATLHAMTGSNPPTVYLAVRVAVATALVVVASPHLSAPLRLVGRGVLVLGAVAAVGLSVTLPIGAVAGVAVGLVAGAVIHLALGSPQGDATPDLVASALAELGVEAVDVALAARQQPGVVMMTARRADDGGALLVKVYGRDSWDTELVGSTWTALTTRGEHVRLGRGRREHVEHEALTSLMAERGGVAVLRVVTAGQTGGGDALLATEAPARAFDELSADDVDEAMLHDLWRNLVRLHHLGIAHGQVDGHSVVLRADGTPALGDLVDAELAADHGALMADRARLLVTTALVVGRQRAVAAAAGVLSADGLAGLLPYLQPAVLDRSTRHAGRAGVWSLAELRAEAVAAAGTEPPPLERLSRVTVRSALTLLAVAVIGGFIIVKLAGVDFQALWEELSSADVAWLVAALLAAPFVQVATAFATMGASVTALRYFPVLMLQYAIQFIAVVLPATAARIALEVRFFERFGIAPGAAVSIGVIDSVGGFVVQICLLLIIILSGLPGLTSSISGSSSTTSTSGSSSSTPSLLVLAIALLLLAVLLAVVVPRTRHRLQREIPRVWTALKEQVGTARSSLGVLRRPGKVATITSGNLVAQLIQAVMLGLCLKAFGGEASLSQLILINTGVSLFAGLMPVPGGVGVAEAGYVAGLQAIGISSTVALSTALAFRLATFYLPPLWGWLAMRWLRRHSYV